MSDMSPTRGASSAASTSSSSTREELLEIVVGSLTKVLLGVGYTAEEVSQAVAQSGAQFDVGRYERSVTLGEEQRDCMEIMCAWRRYPRFLGPDGLPRPLLIDGVDDSFADLFALVNRKGDHRKALGLLVQFEAVQRLPGNRVEALTPTFILGGGGRRPIAADGVMKQLAGYLGVIHNNVNRDCSETSAKFERSCTVALPVEVQAIAERLIADRGQLFIDTLDEHLMRLAATRSKSDRFVEIGVGAYTINLGNVSKTIS